MPTLDATPGASTLQRRRFWRASVHESTTVQITGDQSAAPSRGALLNVSPDGLACLACGADAEGWSVGDRLHMRFALDGDEQLYSVDATLRAKTPASDPEQIILRFQFLAESLTLQARQRLWRATAGTPQPA